MNFFWNYDDVEKVINAYKRKKNIIELGKIVGRSRDEVAVLIMDLGRKGLI